MDSWSARADTTADGPVRIVQLNLAFDDSLATPDALLEAYHTLSGWSRAVTRAGATVHVVQRYSRDTRLVQDAVTYEFVGEGNPGIPDPWTPFGRVLNAVELARPDVVHINGLMFPGAVAALRERLDLRVVIVLQDHSGHVPRPWTPLRTLTGGRWKKAFGGVDAVSFTARELADPWHRVGLPRNATILEIPEASTDLAPDPNTPIRTDLSASPSILWVARLTEGKDPLTALSAVELALPALPRAQCTMVFQGGELEPVVLERIRTTPGLQNCVTPVGRVAHNALPSYYCAADVFLSASHHEGSGYALIESMACGVTPCVTDIPAFRALVGECGRRWPVGDARAAANALVEISAADRQHARRLARARFERALSWDVVGSMVVKAYRALSLQRLGGTSR